MAVRLTFWSWPMTGACGGLSRASWEGAVADGSTPAEPHYDLIDRRRVDVTENVLQCSV